jgi:hypothetical protein
MRVRTERIAEAEVYIDAVPARQGAIMKQHHP